MAQLFSFEGNLEKRPNSRTKAWNVLKSFAKKPEGDTTRIPRRTGQKMVARHQTDRKGLLAIQSEERERDWGRGDRPFEYDCGHSFMEPA